jgi:two-component system chemotaxis response regulator CheY
MRKTVLAIDDSLSIRALMDLVLSGAGYEVVLAEDGLEGLARLSAMTPDIVITDINMPRMDGFGFIERARATKRGRSVPIIVLTSESQAGKKALATRSGVSEWMSKPFNAEQLLRAVKRHTA